MKHDSFLLTILFLLFISLFISANFIGWDESALEQTLLGWILGISFIFEVPFFYLLSFVTPANMEVDYNLKAILIPLLASIVYTSTLYGVVIVKRQLTQSLKLS